ncbi:toprim domain-containing protein [Candidatus Parcubacteria bacterium]|nr:toprim domain-containing protein [Candidatus Parcubacteria bacterium]
MEIRAKDNCVIMEGYTDVILAHQEGFKNAVSVAGTSLTQYQLNILKRYTENLTLAFDMDIGGDSATKRGIDLARIKGFNVKVLILPQGKDPADVLSENPEEFAKMLEKSVSIMDYYLQNALSKYDRKTLEGKKQITKILLPEIKRIENEIEKSFWLSKLSEVLEIREDDLRKELAKLSLKEEFFGLEPEEVAKIEEKPKTKREILEERLIFLVLKFPDFISKIQQEILEYLKEETKEILEVLKGNKKKEELSEQAKEIYFSLALKSEIEEISIEEAEKDFGFCQKEIYLLSIKEELNKISQQLKLKKDDKELLEKFKILSQKIAEIQK